MWRSSDVGRDADKRLFLSDWNGLARSEFCADRRQLREGVWQSSASAYVVHVFLEARSLGGFLASDPDHLGGDRRITGMPAVAWK